MRSLSGIKGQAILQGYMRHVVRRSGYGWTRSDSSLPTLTPALLKWLHHDQKAAGHSPDRYSDLVSNADVNHIPALVDVVFCRGIAIRSAIGRGSENRTLCAPSTLAASRGRPVMSTFVKSSRLP